MNDIIEIMLNPVRTRILQEIAVSQKLTATELCKKINDVPRTTLYRHINILLDCNILSVVAEKKNRGSIERTFALNLGTLSEINSLEYASQNILGLLMNKYAKFQSYLESKNPDPAKDKVFISNSVMMMDDGEFDRFLSELWELIKRYSFGYADGRKARNISIISSPTEEK